jgi:hypothetical protein
VAHYVVESYDHSIDHGGRDSAGVIPENRGSEKIFLHVIPIADDEIKKLAPRVDENGNQEHARLALPRNEVWWIAVEGEASWPGVYRPKIQSRCEYAGGKPRPVPLADADLERLRKNGLKGI